MDRNQPGQHGGGWVPQPPGNASGSYSTQQLGMPPMPPMPPQYGDAPAVSLVPGTEPGAHPWAAMPHPPQPPARPAAVTAVGPSAIMPPGLMGAQGGLPAVSMAAVSQYGVDAGAQWWQGGQQAQGYAGVQLPPLQGIGDPGTGPPPAVTYMMPAAPPPPAAGKKTKKGDGAASKPKQPRAKSKAGGAATGEAGAGAGAPGDPQLPPFQGFPVPVPAEGKKTKRGGIPAMTREQAAAAATACMQQLSSSLPLALHEGVCRLQPVAVGLPYLLPHPEAATGPFPGVTLCPVAHALTPLHTQLLQARSVAAALQATVRGSPFRPWVAW
jgi:hypothetical protein